MKRFFSIAVVAMLAACNSSSTGGVKADSADKMMSSDSINDPPAIPSYTDTTLPHPGDSAKDMINGANEDIKMTMDSAGKMKQKM